MTSNEELTLTPLDTLSILPRELRNQIYRHVQNHKYLWDPYPRAKCLIWQSCDNTINNLSMRMIWKTILEEFLAILHAEIIFCI